MPETAFCVWHNCQQILKTILCHESTLCATLTNSPCKSDLREAPFSFHYLSGSLLLRREPCLPPRSHIALAQPFTRLDQLNDVDHLLAEHDREADTRNNPRYRTVHLIGTRHFQRRCTPRIGKQRRSLRMRRRARLCRGQAVLVRNKK